MRYTASTGRITSLRSMPTRRPFMADAWLVVNGYPNEVPSAARLPARSQRDDGDDAPEHMGAHAVASSLIIVLMIIAACLASVTFA